MEKERRKNDIVHHPRRLHGEPRPAHSQRHGHPLREPSSAEAVRRKTAESGAPVALALPPLMYGGHPYHHIGMPGTVILREEVVEESLVDVMLGLWNDGFRKQIIVNNHGHLWMLETALHKFLKRYQLPGVFKVVEWHRSVKHFFRTRTGRSVGDPTSFTLTRSETSVGLLLFPEMVDMSYAVDTETKALHAPRATSTTPSRVGTADALVRERGSRGHRVLRYSRRRRRQADRADPQKGKRPVVAFVKYLTMVCDDILTTFPAGTTPPVEEFTFRSAKDMEPFLREPLSPGWRPVHALPYIGQH